MSNTERDPDMICNEQYLHPDQPLRHLICKDEILRDLMHHAVAAYPNSRQFVTLTGYFGRGKSTILEALAKVATRYFESLDSYPLIFHYSCGKGEKPKYVFQNLLSEFDVEYYVENKDVSSVWRRVEQELDQSPFDTLYLLLDDVDNLCRREQFIESLVRYRGDAGLGVFVTATFPNWDHGLSADLKSRYWPARYAVENWIDCSPEMITKVLHSRIEEELLPATVSEQVVNYLATQHSKDPFYGFTGALAILYWATLSAKQDGLPISQQHVDYGIERVDDLSEIRRLRSQEFDIHDHALLTSLADAAQADSLPLRTTEIYDLYQKTLAETDIRSLSKRRFRDRITSEEMSGFIETNLSNKGVNGGRSYEVTLRDNNPDAVLTAVAAEGNDELSIDTSIVPELFLKLTEPLT